MGLNSTFNRLLSEPDFNERALLETDIPESSENEKLVNNKGQISFLNGLAGDLDARVVGVHKNTNQRLIVVTQDKTLLTLKRNIARLGKKDWIAPLSTVMTIVIALITSNFKYALGLGPAEWRAIFIVSGFIAAGWLIYTVKKSAASRTFHEVIKDIVFELGARPQPIAQEI